jgi:hypothetical protein
MIGVVILGLPGIIGGFSLISNDGAQVVGGLLALAAIRVT